MKTERNILIAFILNMAFSVFEFIGGTVTGSVAVISDAVHDMGDAASIGVSYFLERKSGKQPDENYTYGYARYSVLGGLITTAILLLGSVMVIGNAVARIITPEQIDYDGMMVLGVIGVCVNFSAAFFTREGGSLNQRAVNLHMLEDVLGWIIVLLGAVVMRFTDFALLDPLMSIGVATFIFINAIKNLKEVLDIFLEKTPRDVDIGEIRTHVGKVDGVLDVHHLHVWSMDGKNNYATMHVVTDREPHKIKDQIRMELKEHGIGHVTMELEASTEHCHEKHCHVDAIPCVSHIHNHKHG